MTDTNDIRKAMPYPTLTPFREGEMPTAWDYLKLQKELIANAASIPSTWANNAWGHLGVLLYDAQLQGITGGVAAYNDPNLPAVPIFAGAAAVVATQREQHQRDMEVYHLHMKVANALKAQIIEAVPDALLAAEKDPITGYGQVPVRDLLTHLQTMYGDITDDDLVKNLELAAAPWNPDTTPDSVFAQVTEARSFAEEGGDPISDNQAMRIIQEAFEKSGVMDEALKDWRKKPANEKNLDNLKEHFAAAYKELKRNTTTKTAGYNTANQAVTEDGTPKYYCYTHGLGYNPKHTSKTCTKPCTTHKKKATLNNMMGGNNTIQRKRGEKAEWKPTRRNNTDGPAAGRRPVPADANDTGSESE